MSTPTVYTLRTITPQRATAPARRGQTIGLSPASKKQEVPITRFGNNDKQPSFAEQILSFIAQAFEQLKVFFQKLFSGQKNDTKSPESKDKQADAATNATENETVEALDEADEIEPEADSSKANLNIPHDPDLVHELASYYLDRNNQYVPIFSERGLRVEHHADPDIKICVERLESLLDQRTQKLEEVNNLWRRMEQEKRHREHLHAMLVEREKSLLADNPPVNEDGSPLDEDELKDFKSALLQKDAHYLKILRLERVAYIQVKQTVELYNRRFKAVQEVEKILLDTISQLKQALELFEARAIKPPQNA